MTSLNLEQVELQTRPPPAKYGPRRLHEESLQLDDRLERRGNVGGLLAEAGSLEPTETPFVEITQRWNEPGINVFRVGAVFWSFLVMGANDAAYGALIPSLETYYNLSYTVVSMVFISPFAGYILSAITANWLHLKLGQRGIAIVGGICHIIAYLIIASHPSYVVLIMGFVFAGLANGLGEATWNAWMGSLANASELLGFMHACYGVGGIFSPLVSTAMMTKGGLPWYSFYYIMVGFSAVELLGLTWAFWASDGAASKKVYRQNEMERETTLKAALFRRPAARTSWITALFLLCYFGAEVALGGWIVVFMTSVRGGEAFASGMTATGFWLGITLGRALLGFVTPRLGVKISILSYIVATMGLELLFWLVPQFYVSAVAVAFQGFFLGPLLPGVVLAASQILPRHQHVIVIGFAAAVGGGGAAILPFAVGVLAQVSGVQVLQPIILGLLGVLLCLWLSLPKIDKRSD